MSITLFPLHSSPCQFITAKLVACAGCLIPAAGRTVIADETVSSSLLLSICVYSSVILCTVREERTTRGGERQEFEQRAGHLHLSWILINTEVGDSYEVRVCVCNNSSQLSVVKIHHSEGLITLGSFNYPCIIFIQKVGFLLVCVMICCFHEDLVSVGCNV